MALLHLEQAQRLAPDDARADLVTAFAHLVARREAEARRGFEAIIVKDPSARGASLGLLRCALLRADPEAAAAIALRTIGAGPDDTAFAAAATTTLADAGYGRHAARVSAAAAAARPADSGLAKAAVQAALAANEFDLAAKIAASFRDACAHDVRSFADLLQAQSAVPRLATAPLAVEICRRIESDAAVAPTLVAAARSVRAHALLTLGNPSEARAVAEIVISDSGSHADVETTQRALQIAGVAALDAGDPKEAARFLTRALESAPRDALLLNNAAWALAQDPATAARAQELALRATGIAPGVPAYWDTRGSCAAAAQDVQEAEASWRQALILFAATPDADPGARARTAIRLARLLRSTGHASAAQSIAAQVASFDPPAPDRERQEAARIATED
jgi:tetratricopeptide (TPR) repeat protein